ncbi:hypothetical protein [Rhodopirellula bahusiensis]|nr:hypothetical protein [Rhodopirellula bahusiensis]
MGKPSKEERKRMRREAEQSIRIEDFFSHVVSPTATLANSPPSAIVDHASQVGVALQHREIDATSHSFGVPDADWKSAVVIGYTDLTHEIVRQAEFYDWLLDDVERLQLGLPTITFRAKVNLDPVVDFLHQTMLRVLGRLTHGILISGTGRAVIDDWLAWSLDYDDPDMFNVNRVYDESQPDFHALLDRFPQLRSPGA